MEQLPRRVAQPEERPAVGGDEKALVVGNLQPRERRLRAGTARVNVAHALIATAVKEDVSQWRMATSQEKR